ncbi:hypothetical protein ERYG_04197 [Escherichia coli M114]|nr:hypothetical protein ERYG_04197 [Escherichia coli M114]
MIDEHIDYALALAVLSLNSDIVNHFFSRAARLFPVGISQSIIDNGKEFLGSFDKTLQEATQTPLDLSLHAKNERYL